jgi:glycosyltransferase involved in cell wall biosynthesis
VKYAVVTPAHNEAENLGQLRASLEQQTQRPETWVIVENGSTDDTLEVASLIRDEVSWTHVLSIPGPDRADRGAPIVRAINDGISFIQTEVDVVVVVDGDVTFPVDYFEVLLGRFAADPSLGMASGTCYERENGEWRERHVTGDHVWGASRAYRWEVLPVVMPLVPRMGWDGIDQLKANVAGWRTATFKDLPFYHHRPEGTRDGSAMKARVNQGRASYYMGYRPVYLLLRTLYAARRDPAALALLWGYASDGVRRVPRCEDRAVVAHLREQQRLGLYPRRLREARGRR